MTIVLCLFWQATVEPLCIAVKIFYRYSCCQVLSCPPTFCCHSFKSVNNAQCLTGPKHRSRHGLHKPVLLQSANHKYSCLTCDLAGTTGYTSCGCCRQHVPVAIRKLIGPRCYANQRCIRMSSRVRIIECSLALKRVLCTGSTKANEVGDVYE